MSCASANKTAAEAEEQARADVRELEAALAGGKDAMEALREKRRKAVEEAPPRSSERGAAQLLWLLERMIVGLGPRVAAKGAGDSW